MKSAKSIHQKIVSFGEVMMRLSPPGHQRFQQATQLEVHYGGSDANVSVALAQFGLATEHVSCFPDNDFGRSAVAHLRACGVDASHVVFQEGRMGVYFIEHGADYRSSKVIYDRYDSAFAKLNPSMFDWEEILQGATWFHWCGITPAISDAAASACGDAIRAARQLGVKISADINYRRNLWNYGKAAREVMPSLISLSDLVIGGAPDFENCAGIESKGFEDGCKKLTAKFPAVKVIVNTERESLHASLQRIHGLLWKSNTLLKSKTYDLTDMVDRVGAGDAFVAGIIFGQLTGMEDQESLEFGAASCVLKHSIPGDVSRVSAEEVKALVRGENVGKLLR